MIELINLSKRYQTKTSEFHALNNVSLTISSREIFGIIGKSGAGKSTLIRCVNLLEKPSNGRVRVANKELTALTSAGLRQARRGMGMIFQHFNLLSSVNVYQNIALPLTLLKLKKQAIATVVSPLLE